MTYTNYIHDANTARLIDATSIQNIGIPSMVLMERAAYESVQVIKKNITYNQTICILCGPGNNGGDGLAIARLLTEDGYSVVVFAPAQDKMSVDELNQYKILKKLHIPVNHSVNDILIDIKYADVIIDCLFGNGLSRDITGLYQTIIEAVNSSKAFVFSIDVPSGLHATSGKILNCAIQADVTIALDCFKTGHFINDGPVLCNEKVCVNIGIPNTLHSHGAILLNENIASSILPVRDKHGHKGTFKKALMIGGSSSMHGAITYAAMACYKSGIGTLTLMIPDCIGDIIAKKMECAMNLRQPSKDGFFDSSSIDVESIIAPYQLISVGNGMGQNQNTIDIVKKVLQSNKTVVLDADAMWAIRDEQQLLQRNAYTILTPHIKEMSYLTGKSTKEILESPFEIVEEFTKTYPNCVIILKSSITIIADSNHVYVLDQPNSALAKGGSGDILCGIVNALCGQTSDYLKASACACYIHSESARKDIDPACYQPQDCIDEIANVFKKIRVEK